MTKIKVKFTVEVPTSGIKGELMEVRATMPFVPQPEMMIIAVPGDDYRKVDQVYYSAADGLEVFFEEAHQTFKQMKKTRLETDPLN